MIIQNLTNRGKNHDYSLSAKHVQVHVWFKDPMPRLVSTIVMQSTSALRQAWQPSKDMTNRDYD